MTKHLENGENYILLLFTFIVQTKTTLPRPLCLTVLYTGNIYLAGGVIKTCSR